MSDDREEPEMLIARPATVEEMLFAIGAKEIDERVEIMLTTDVVADICWRLVRLEEVRKEREDE